MAPKSGALDFVGDSFERVAQSAVNRINEEGGINGRELVLIVGDTQTNPAVIDPSLDEDNPSDDPGLFENMINDDLIIASVGPATSGEVDAAWPIAAEYRVPIISPSSTAPFLSNADIADEGYMFRNVPDDLIQGKAMAHYFRNLSDPPVETVTVLFEDTDYGRGLKDAFKVEFENLGGTVNANEVGFDNNLQHFCCAAAVTSCGDTSSCEVHDYTCGIDHSDEVVEPGDPPAPDLTALPKLCPGSGAVDAIADVATNAPSITVMVALEQDAVELALAWDNDGVPVVPEMQFFMTDGARSQGFLNLAPDSVAGMCGTAPTFPVTGLAYGELEETFEADNPDESLDNQVFAPNVWDGFYLLAAAMLHQSEQYPGEALGGAHLRDAITEVSAEGQTFHAGQWRDIVLAINNGSDVDYDGAAGPNDFNVVGQAIGPYEVWCVNETVSQFTQEVFLEAEDIQAL